MRGNILICMKSTGMAGSTPKADSDEKDSVETTRVEALPAQYRRLVRQVVHAMVKEEGQLETPRCTTCKIKLEAGRSSRGGLEARVRTKMARLRVAQDERLAQRVLAVAMRLYDEHADLIRAKIAERKLVCRLCRTPVRKREHAFKRRVRFGCSSLFAGRSDAFPDREPGKPVVDDLYGNVYSVSDRDDTRRRPKPGLVEVSAAESESDAGEEPSFLQDGKRVIGAVGGVEAVSAGYIDCTPVEMLIDTGTIPSLVNSRVLKRVGRANTPLRPSNKDLNGVTGHMLRIWGEIDLPLRVGSLEVMRPFVVVGRLHVDTMLGTDTLKELRAVIDLEENTLTLKGTGEVFPLGTPRVEEMHSTRISSTVRLRPGGQALVVTDVQGKAPEDATVLIEGLQEVDATVRVARTLCTVHNGKVLVEVCNASTEEVIFSKITLLAAATVVPETAFASSASTDGGKTPASEESRTQPEENPSWIDSILSATATDASSSQGMMPELEKVLQEELDVDFSDSKLNEEQRALLRSLLELFRDMFVETSMTPGRTDLLQFSVDTGTHPPIKQRPYRVSKAEGDVMEAEIQQYLKLGHIRPSTSPWASLVLMIRKPDGGIRFCIDYRRLNAVTIKDCYPMPLIDDILDVLGKAKLFSTMDIASGYWNVPMAADSVEKTAFTCKYGLCEWLVMPFGLCNAVPAFERLMENVLIDLEWRTCLVYLDDCVVFSDDFPTHLVRLKQVLERFRNAGFKLKMKKCKWGRAQVAFLGHIVTPSGILPNPEKVKSVMNVKRPHDLHTVRAFLGLTSYFRRYIPGYAGISAPIERLKLKGAAGRTTAKRRSCS
ncbi:hypothetical protein PF010_g15789 [Phytophthora fragariae]|uniref:Reverse transcriptase domain-containing protein n=1 Tax=Phytophthora fragariae TaxID=53985 RepID=A0A6A3EWW7_9STRA|nr:hypothetical protein PF003_g39400 [Phytophthora fragariae]KAE8938014.1 hypothetical protein PF009_g12088 [Phytophthora fragariae]KAE9097798.1 hypothetical protein PF007_g16497 [Phytophthora fragariae]KAE9097869.1 hypothetical protein PF010_g15789 [Phytophthora fragariae]KAE9132294.1 hypothetical protein PF006_g15312 [Phytophthora fragariae]